MRSPYDLPRVQRLLNDNSTLSNVAINSIGRSNFHDTAADAESLSQPARQRLQLALKSSRGKQQRVGCVNNDARGLVSSKFLPKT